MYVKCSGLNITYEIDTIKHEVFVLEIKGS